MHLTPTHSPTHQPAHSQKQSRLFKTKKFFASKTAQTKLGRKVIFSYLGDSANALLDSLKTAAKRDAGKKKAEKMIKLILKLALKGKLLYDEKYITPVHIRSMVNPVNDMTTKLYEGLEYEGPMPAHMFGLLHAKFTVLEDLLVQIIGPNMQPKNVDKLREVIQYFGGEHLLSLLLNDPNYKQERDTIEGAVGALVAPLIEEERDRRARCADPECENPHLKAGGGFRGSPLCAYHHNEVVERHLKDPSVMHFLVEDGRNYKPFQAVADKHFSANSSAFVLAIHNYEHKAAPNVRRLFAEAIHEKYLAKGASNPVELGEEHRAKIEKVLQNLKNMERPEPSLYSEAARSVLSHMDPAFNEFKASKDYKSYVEGFQLPKHMKKEATAQKKAAGK